jgi:predicted double-glycine peptidase
MKRVWLLLSAFAIALPACGFAGTLDMVHSGGGNFRLHVSSLKALRQRDTIHQQYDFSCGSAAVATLLTYQYDYPMSEQIAFTAMYRHGNQAKIRQQGFSLLDMKRFLAANGFQADGFVVPLNKLKKAHIPAIVLINEGGYHHFVVIKGLRNDRVLVGDPAKGTRSMPRAEFMKMWKNHLLFVIHNHRNAAIFNSARDWHAAPMAKLGSGIDRRGLYHTVMPKRGPGDF